MVAIINHSTSIRRILNYNEQKLEQGKASLILASQFLCDIEQLSVSAKLNRFKYLNDQNKKVKTNTLHVSLNFDPSEKISVERLQDIAIQYMDGIGFGDQPFLVYQHFDAAHPHIHIISTLVQKDGTRINTHNIGRLKSEPVRRDLEQRFNLVKAENHSRNQPEILMPINIERASYGKSETKKEIGRVVSAVIKDYNFGSIAELNAALRCFNVCANSGTEGSYLQVKKGLQYRILDSKGNAVGVPIKASLIYSKPTLQSIEKSLEHKRLRRRYHADRLKTEIGRVLQSDHPLSKHDFSNLLAHVGITVSYRTNDEGRTYGITFVDHRTKCVFKGSDLGKDFSANAIVARLTNGSQLHKQETKESLTDPLSGLIHDDKAAGAKIVSLLMDQDQQSSVMPYELRPKKKRRKNRIQ